MKANRIAQVAGSRLANQLVRSLRRGQKWDGSADWYFGSNGDYFASGTHSNGAINFQMFSVRGLNKAH